MRNFLRKEKVVLFLFIILMVVSPLFAGGSQGAASGQAKQYLIRLGHSNSPDPDNIITFASTIFANRVAELTNNGVKVEIYPLNQTGSDIDQLTALQNGSQEMNYTAMTSIAPICPPMYVYNLPYLFTEPDKVVATLMALWDKNNDLLVRRSNIRLIGYAVAGFRQLSTSSRYVAKDLASLRGMKVRIPPNAVSEATFRKLGLEPVALGVNELFTSLQQGVVHGQENCLTFVRSEHLNEVQTYVLDINWLYNVGAFTMAEPFFQSLPKNYQDAVLQAGREATTQVIDKFKVMDADDIRVLKEGGMQFVGRPTDYDKWVEIGKSVWPDSYALIGDGDAQAGKTFVDEVLAIINKQ